MRITPFLFAMLLSYLAIPLDAQIMPVEKTLQFSLGEAKDYALTNSPILLNSARDVEIAKKQVWESTSIGLPQANINGSYSYTPQLAGLSEQLGEFIPDFDPNALKTSIFGSFQVDQLLFSGQYLIGVKAAKVYANMSVLANTKSKIGVVENITNNYFSALVARQSKSILDSTLAAVEKTRFETEQMYKNGFVEETDVDQLKILSSNIKSSLSVAERQIDLMERLLKFQMGLSIDQPIVLTDNIDALVLTMDVEVSAIDSFVLDRNIDYKIASNQEYLMQLNQQVKKSEYLPSVSGYYSYYKSFDDNFFNDQSPSTFGLSFYVPIFSSGQRAARVSQSKLSYLKAKTNKEIAAESLRIQYQTALSEYISAHDIYILQKENRELSLRIYTKSITKFREGIGSSLDLNQTQSQYFDAEGVYYRALMSLVSAKSKLESLLANSIN
jgi:outer membrane protein